jgi:RNA polymerase sigma-70 factor (ECF subfamily)
VSRLDAEAMRALLARAVGRHCPSEFADRREDLVHTALLRVFERTAGEKPPSLEASYLWRVAFSVVMDEIRKHRRSQSRSAQLEVLASEESAGPDLGLEIRECVAQVPPTRRTAVILHLQGFRLDEVAAILRKERKQIENLVYRGLTDVRRCLEGRERPP